jgi:hypothetical protein
MRKKVMNGRRSHEFYDEVNTANYVLSKVFSGIDARGHILSVCQPVQMPPILNPYSYSHPQ